MATAIMLCNMGGPENLQDVRAYLENIFLDPEIIPIPIRGPLRHTFAAMLAGKRAPKTRKIFESMGGASPLLEITRHQAEALEAVLDRGKEEFQVFPAMRYWRPLIPDVWNEIRAQKFDRIIVVSMFAYYSSATAGSVCKLVGELMQTAPTDAELLIIDRFGNHPEFIGAMAGQIVSYVGQGADAPVHVLFSAHGIPVSNVNKGDPYRDEIEKAVEQLRQVLPEHYQLYLSFQSKIGPVKWLGPDTPDKIDELVTQGVETLWVYPLGFVADNSETIYEIGKLYKEHAQQAGIKQYYRIPALNEHPAFIKALHTIIRDSIL